MKLKKFFAGVLAAAMMLTVGATAAFATEPSDGATTATATKTEIKYNMRARLANTMRRCLCRLMARLKLI